MPVKEFAFRKTDLVQGLAASGLRAGDGRLVQTSLTRIGQSDGENSIAETCKETLEALLEVVGPGGTLFVPAFTLSSSDARSSTQSILLPWRGTGVSRPNLQRFRRHSGAVRSEDPLCSVVGIGRHCGTGSQQPPNTSFGRDSVFERLLKLNARLCLIGVDLGHSVLFDLLEESAAVPWRYKKLFTGRTLRSGASKRQGWVASVTNEAIAEKSRAIRNRCASEAGDLWSCSNRHRRNSLRGNGQSVRCPDIKAVG